MLRDRIVKPFGAMVALSGVLVGWSAAAHGEWPQWGGPTRNFVLTTGGIRLDWPGAGPKRAWEAELGAGSSSVIVDDHAAYTLYRSGQEEVVVAFDAETGAKLWEYKYASPIPEGFPEPERLGPRASPAMTGVRIFTIGSLGHITCLNKTSGKMIWSYDPVKEFKLQPPKTGYAASPLIYMDRVLLSLGSEGGKKPAGLFAFHQRAGSWLWNYHEFEPVTVSPIIATMGGKDQLIVAAPGKLAAMDPLNGNIRWEVPWPAASGAVWNASRETMLVTAVGATGSNVLQVPADKPLEHNQLWKGTTPKWTRAVATGNVAIGSTTGNPARICAIGLTSGEELWCDESFASSQFLFTGNSLLILDDQGTLGLADIDKDRLTIHSRSKLEKSGDWAAPAMEDRRLYLRDNKRVLVLDLR